MYVPIECRILISKELVLTNLATKEKRTKYVLVVFSIFGYLLVTGHVEELCWQQQAKADMQKPVGLCFVHQGSTS